MNTIVANKAEEKLGDRPTTTTNEYNSRADETMLALRWHGDKDVRIEEVPAPTITEPTDVIVRVTGTTVCGSDLHLYHKEIMQLQEGEILGHEFMGIADEVGSEVTSIKKGDRVVASFQIACGKCQFCKEGLTSMCDRTNSSALQEKLYGKPFAGLFGYSHFAGGFAGGQAEYVRVPFASYNLLKIPDHVPNEKALYLSDIVPTSYHATVCADVEKGKSVAVWGLGPVGMLACQWSKLAGARRVIAIDQVPERLARARDMGCDTIDFSKQKDVVSAIYELEAQGVDCCIDAAAFRYTKTLLHSAERLVGLETDSSEIPNETLRAVRKFGTVAVVADYAAMTNQFLIGALMEKGITYRGCGQAPVQKYWHQLLEKIERGEFDPTIVLTHRFSIEEFSDLYKAFDEKKHGILKTYVQTRFSPPRTKGTPPLSTLRSGDLKPVPAA
ncbi:putative zinc-type alcohol dehydrogenase-like protein [Exophiala viscosa]|uniref:Zinc-type alcohol dehydrogenase-like protein n=1 Tax=Exophiala viscosa TaxID=2486360 RepID=A0AAN6DMW5_9EURO|nr:putative zinc-type alcohol dehydrogenase-like protein [Exophiala viscosa]KAI1620813.1 putative zinc-type alcohol dehydrogenase-like protein [Exophiala viscosa]